ncbi:MAG: hypothetical protein EXX96DRAFT_608349 [Benjaminiella poitrasii]|nr:MAG: hypothetical protein EXX96DRAFT_608349 [Benjaminiella poitrasii]
MQHDQQLIFQNDFCDGYSTPVLKESLSEELFNIDHVQKKRYREASPSTSKTALDYGISTDGHLTNCKTNINITNWKRGQYRLDKQPSGFLPSDRIIGLDPDIRNFATAVYEGHEQFVDKPSSKASSISLSNVEYKICSGFAWCIQEELKKRRHAGIQPYYNIIPTAKVATSREFFMYTNALSAVHTKIFNFMKGYKHHTPFKLCHRSNKNERKRIKKSFFFFEERQMSSRDIQNGRIVVAYSDAGFSHATKGHTSVPIRKLQRSLAKKSVVITVDELRTSKICSHCHSDLDDIHVPRKSVRLKKRNRIRQVEKNASRKCFLDIEAGNIYISKTSQCPYKSATIWDHDVNAAINIRSVLINYILSGCNINSRLTPLLILLTSKQA